MLSRNLILVTFLRRKIASRN